MLRRSRRPASAVPASRRLYDLLVARAREPIFHTGFAVPDTIDGRFDLLTLHAFLVLDALKSLGDAGDKLGTELASVIFAGFDEALRELGVGDFGISRRMKALAGAFYGRLEAYHAADGADQLAPVLLRNLYRGEAARTPEAARLAHYMLSAREHVMRHAGGLLEGSADFGPLPNRELMT
jgi:cytochrome b pre-mRNA-processing protein 3